MATLVLGTPPPELQAFRERRHRAGVDRRDEVWQGVHHMVPGPSFEHARVAQQLAVLMDGPARAAGLLAVMDFNLGETEEDFRVPDGGHVAPDRRARRGLTGPAATASQETAHSLRSLAKARIRQASRHWPELDRHAWKAGAAELSRCCHPWQAAKVVRSSRVSTRLVGAAYRPEAQAESLL